MSYVCCSNPQSDTAYRSESKRDRDQAGATATTSISRVFLCLVLQVKDAKGLGLAFIIGKFDGICGLAFDEISVEGIQPPFAKLVQDGGLDEPVRIPPQGYQRGGGQGRL